MIHSGSFIQRYTPAAYIAYSMSFSYYLPFKRLYHLAGDSYLDCSFSLIQVMSPLARNQHPGCLLGARGDWLHMFIKDGDIA